MTIKGERATSAKVTLRLAVLCRSAVGQDGINEDTSPMTTPNIASTCSRRNRIVPPSKEAFATKAFLVDPLGCEPSSIAAKEILL
jgi:hypothetical protein